MLFFILLAKYTNREGRKEQLLKNKFKLMYTNRESEREIKKKPIKFYIFPIPIPRCDYLWTILNIRFF
jgi:hypothetical protein